MKKIKEIEVVTTILTIFVILIHASSEPLTVLEKGSIFNNLFFTLNKFLSFVVPCFIFLSALKLFYSFNKTNVFSYKDFMRRRFLKIFIPYIIFCNIYYFYFIYRDFAVFNFQEYVIGMFNGKIASHLYFIIIIFQFYILIPFFRFFTKKVNPTKGIFLTFVINLLLKMLPQFFYGTTNPILKFILAYSDRIFLFYSVYFVLGAYAALYYERFIKLLTSKKIVITLFYILIFIIHTYLSFENYMGNMDYILAEGFHLIFCVVSVLLLYIISIYLTKLDLKIFSVINKLSFYIYLIHVLFIYIIDHKFHDLGMYRTLHRFAFRTVFVIFFSILVSYIIVYFIELLKKTRKRTF